MTAPHDLSSQTGPRPTARVLKIVGALVLVAMFVAGVVSFLPGGLGGALGRGGPPEVEGNIVWDSEDQAVQLGPDGWLTHPAGGGDYSARNVRTGESWTIGELASQMSISQEGVVVQPDGTKVLVQREGSTRTVTTKDIADELGDDDLWPGENVDLVAFGEEHVVVATCLAPSPSRLLDEVEGGHVVFAGLSLEDASIAWVRDVGARCGGDFWHPGKPKTLPAQPYVLLEPSEDHLVVVDVATGETVLSRSGQARYKIAIHGDRVLVEEDEGEVAWRSLRTGKEITRVRCDGARVGSTGDISRQVPPEGTPFVECADGVRVLDGDRVVEIDAQPLGLGEGRLPEGRDVAVGRHVMHREGKVVTVRDGLEDKEIGRLDVPEDFEVAGWTSPGRFLVFASVDTGGERPTSAYRAFDARTGELVLSTSGGMRTGADVSPDGVIVVESDDEDLEGTRLWVAATKEAP